MFLFSYLTSPDNRHALPLFTSLLNTVCSYDPVGLGVPYNHLLFADTLEPLVEVMFINPLTYYNCCLKQYYFVAAFVAIVVTTKHVEPRS